MPKATITRPADDMPKSRLYRIAVLVGANACAASWATLGPTRRTPLDPPSPDEASGWFCGARRVRGATPAVRRPSTPTGDRTTPAGSAAAQRSDKADATTRVTIMPRRLTTPIPLVRGTSRLLEPR